LRIAFEGAHEPAVAADPCGRSLDNPSFWYDREMVQFGSLDALYDPTSCGGGHAYPLISRIAKIFRMKGQSARVLSSSRYGW
jgi:hypothetical protein